MVILITSVVLVNATMTITLPNAVSFPFNLAPGGTMGIAVPTIDRPVLLMGATHTVGFRGIGHVSILRANAAPGLIMWTGLESAAGSAITSGFSSALGTHVVYIDFAHQVDIQVLNAAGVRVRNGAGAPRAGNVTMIW